MEIKFPIKIKRSKNQGTARKESSKLVVALKKALEFLGRRFLLSSIFVIILALIIGGYFFYIYVFSLEKVEPPLTEQPLIFNEEAYRKVFDDLGKRDIRFRETDAKTYPDLFQESIPSAAEGLTE
jgi:uncharacterized protein YneF (UPF0154 family)